MKINFLSFSSHREMICLVVYLTMIILFIEKWNFHVVEINTLTKCYLVLFLKTLIIYIKTAALEQSVRVFALHLEWSGFESQPRQTLVVQVVTAPLPNIQQQVWMRRVLGDEHYMYTDALCHNRCGTLKNPQDHCSLATSAKCRSKYKALHR